MRRYVVIKFKTLKQFAFASSHVLADKALRYYHLRSIVFRYDDLAIATMFWTSLQESSRCPNDDFTIKGCSLTYLDNAIN